MFMLANSTLFMPSSTRPSQLAEDATGKKRDHDLEHVKPVLKTGLGQHTLLRLAYAIVEKLFTHLHAIERINKHFLSSKTYGFMV